MPTIRRRPTGTNFDVSPHELKKTQAFNKDLRLVQGYRNAIAASSTTPISISLGTAGELLLGISIMPASGTLSDIADCQITFTVNNQNLLQSVQAQNLCPNYIQGFLFFPTPQHLQGSDTLSLQVIKNNAGAITIITNIFYVPRM